MKIVSAIAKILAALAFIAGVVYLVATYGDKIVAWAKKLLGGCPCCDCDGNCDTCDCDCDCVEEDIDEVAEEVVEETTEEAPAADEETVVASDADFEG